MPRLDKTTTDAKRARNMPQWATRLMRLAAAVVGVLILLNLFYPVVDLF